MAKTECYTVRNLRTMLEVVSWYNLSNAITLVNDLNQKLIEAFGGGARYDIINLDTGVEVSDPRILWRKL